MKTKKNYCRKYAMVAIAVLSLYVLCNNTQASNNVSSMQEIKAGAIVSTSALAPADDILAGTWTIDRVKVKKTTGNVSSENTYSLKQKFETFVPCPQKITFTADRKMVLEYDNGTSSSDKYTIEGSQIKRMAPVAVYTYEYKITNTGELQLIYSIDYSRNSTSIVEEYTYFGTKK